VLAQNAQFILAPNTADFRTGNLVPREMQVTWRLYYVISKVNCRGEIGL